VPVTGAPSDAELLELLRGRGERAEALARRPYRYATSAPLEQIEVRTAGSADLDLIFKDLSRDRLLGDAAATKPVFLHQPGRELDTYREILDPAGIGPRLFASVAEPERRRHWLLIEKVQGVELWQVGELEVWEGVAAWLGRFHARFQGRAEQLRAANPHLLGHSRDWFCSWAERARAALARSSDPRASAIAEALRGYDEVVAAITRLPVTLVHGEFYPSNVLVAGDPGEIAVYPVDWEMAATGPGMIDLAALVGGWGAGERRRLLAAYLDGPSESTLAPARAEAAAADLARCRLALALQWLGWSADWRPPAEHAHDWIGEAEALVRELRLG
jgi:Ser/Thr protein kinase RdoA (MazF antagonist)